MGLVVKSVKRPLINYFGGKWRLAPWIIENLPAHKIYIEPFGGSLSVLLRKERSKREIINDVDGELVNLYRVARDQGKELQEKLRLTPHSRCEYRLSMEPAEDPIERARRTVVRCYFGIGDSFLWNHNAFRNSKDSNTCVASSWKSYHESFEGIIDRLAGVTIENLSYERLFEKYDGTDVVWYLDPPYVPQTRTKKHAYREDWSALKHVQFLGEVKKLKGHVVLSGYDSDIYRSELQDWNITTKEALTNGAKKRTELLWIKNKELS